MTRPNEIDQFHITRTAYTVLDWQITEKYFKTCNTWGCFPYMLLSRYIDLQVHSFQTRSFELVSVANRIHTMYAALR